MDGCRRCIDYGDNDRWNGVASDTIDEAMLWARKSKKRGQDALFAGLQQLAKQRRRK